MARTATEIIIATGYWADPDEESFYAFVPTDMSVDDIERAVQLAIDHNGEASWYDISGLGTSDWVGSTIEPVSNATRDEFLAQCQQLPNEFYALECPYQVLVSRCI